MHFKRLCKIFRAAFLHMCLITMDISLTYLFMLCIICVTFLNEFLICAQLFPTYISLSILLQTRFNGDLHLVPHLFAHNLNKSCIFPYQCFCILIIILSWLPPVSKYVVINNSMNHFIMQLSAFSRFIQQDFNPHIFAYRVLFFLFIGVV